MLRPIGPRQGAMGTFFNHPAGNNQNKNTAPRAGLSGTGNPTCCARLPPPGGRWVQKCSLGCRPERNRPLICCARLAPVRGQWVLSSTIQPGKNKNAASGAGLSGTGNPICCARLPPPGGRWAQKMQPRVRRPERNRPLICCARLAPARGAMGAFFNPAIQPEKTKMQPRGPACAEPVRGCCAERRKMKEKRKEMR